MPGAWQGENITVARYGGEIGNRDDGRRARRLAQPSEDRVLMIIGDEPFEAFGLAVAGMEGGIVAIEAVKIADEGLHALVRRMIEKMPVEAVGLAPFGPGGEFLAHEQELL